MQLPTPIIAGILFAALVTAGIALIVAGSPDRLAALPPVGAGLLGGAVAYFLVEVSAWDRRRSGR